MKSILDRYLDRVLLYANRPESESEGIRQELKDHLLQKVEDLAGNGLPREEAILETLRQHGSPKTIGYKLRGSFPWIDRRTKVRIAIELAQFVAPKLKAIDVQTANNPGIVVNLLG